MGVDDQQQNGGGIEAGAQQEGQHDMAEAPPLPPDLAASIAILIPDQVTASVSLQACAWPQGQGTKMPVNMTTSMHGMQRLLAGSLAIMISSFDLHAQDLDIQLHHS